MIGIQRSYIFIVILLLLGLNFQRVSAQSSSDSIFIRGEVFHEYYQYGSKLKISGLESALQRNNNALTHFHQSRKFDRFHQIALFCGGALLVLNVYEMINHDTYNWWYGGLGLGMISVSVPLSRNAGKLRQQAINRYNRTLSE